MWEIHPDTEYADTYWLTLDGKMKLVGCLGSVVEYYISCICFKVNNG